MNKIIDPSNNKEDDEQKKETAFQKAFVEKPIILTKSTTIKSFPKKENNINKTKYSPSTAKKYSPPPPIEIKYAPLIGTKYYPTNNKKEDDDDEVVKQPRINWDQCLRTNVKTKIMKRSFQYILLLKTYDNIVDFTNILLLKSFITPYGKIKSRIKTRISCKLQRKIGKAIRRARAYGLIPFSFVVVV